MSHSRLLHLLEQLEGELRKYTRHNPETAQYVIELIGQVENGESENAQRFIDLQGSERKTDAIPLDQITVSMSAGFHNKGIREDWRANQVNAGFGNLGGKGVFAHSFRRMTITPKNFVQTVSSGFAWAVGVYTDNHRIKSKFQSSQVLALDFDDCVSIPELLEIPFIQHYALCLHPTPSHQPDYPKTRVIFVLDTPVINGGYWELLQLGLLDKFTDFHPDPKCKDCARFFYGCDTPGTVINTQAVLPLSVVTKLAEKHILADEIRRNAPPPPPMQLSDDGIDKYVETAIDNELMILRTTPDGMRNNQLFKSGCSLFGLSKGNYPVTDGYIESQLKHLGASVGLASHEIEATIQSALRTAQPRYMEIR